jgi:hypothetical protein
VDSEKSIARKRHGKQVSVATDTQATIEELLGTTFFIGSVPSGYKRRELRFGSAVCSCATRWRLRRDGDPVHLSE